MKLKKYHYFFLFVSFLFLGIASIELFSDGMFIDGLLYADISRNMAKGLGSFWKPHLTNTFGNVFHGHPPLAFGLESIFFYIFGDSIYVERFYSLLTYVIVGYLIVLIWSKLTGDKKTGWFPLLLWLSSGGVTWALANNMLENTMSVFVCLSLLFYLNSFDKRRFIWIILSGLALFLALLTKGFVCLYIWGSPFFIWALMRKRNFSQMIIDSFILVLVTILPIVLLYFLIPSAQISMLSYFKIQIIGSFENIQTVNSRFAIIGDFFKSIIFPLIFSLIAIILALKKKVNKHLFKKNIKEALVFFAITLSGVIPVMISLKQRGFYILTVYPIFAIGLAYYLYPIISAVVDNMKISAKVYKIFKIITLCVVFIGISLSVSQINRVGRDKDIVLDSKTIIEVVGKDKTINICPEMRTMWFLHAYMSRYGNVSLEYNQNNIHKYYISIDNCNSKMLEDKYDLIPTKTKKLKLYRLNPNCQKNYVTE